MTPRATPSPGERDADRSRWRAFAVCLGAGFVTLLDVSIVNVALPSVERSLAAGPAELQWIVAGYTLAFGLSLVPAGRIGDVLGRRGVFVAGLTAFVLASAACGLATTPEMLALTRVVQGLSAGVLNPQVVGLIQQLFTGRDRGRAFGLFGATIGISTATGPLLGGALLALFGEAEGWRSVFLVNVPIGAVLIVLALRYLPRPAPGADRAPRARLDIDVVGLVLVAASVLCVMLPFISLAERSANTPWWLLGVAVVVLVVFWWWERRTERAGRAPVLSASLLRTRSFTFGAAVGTAYFAGFTGIFLVGTLYLQLGLGLTPLEAGLVQTPFALVGAVSAALSGRLVERFGRWTVVVGIVVMSAGIVGVDITVGRTDGVPAALAMAAWLALAGLGNGVVISPNQTLTLHDVPVAEGGTAGGVLQTTQRIGAAVGIAIISSVFFSTLATDGGPGALAHGFGPALSAGLRVTLGLFVLAVLIAVVDAVRRSHGEPVSPAGAPPPA
ncbi:MFS transporter [Georgenia sp. SYP-B2076]|uniref:MFS transporter n=1 Tax=Georgenia sp. SYP-B2076 TaxID=2495881 RepID=UPI000F8F0133|nr:MFS transporter [Georgenia sp. SYP-B2076]